MDNRQKEFIGKHQLYQVIARNSSETKTFLNRNLKAALDSHERRLLSRGKNQASDATTTPTQKQIKEKHTSLDWDHFFADVDMAYYQPIVRPTLRIGSICLRSKNSTSKDDTVSTAHASQEIQCPDWLPPPDEVRLRCYITVIVQDLRKNDTIVFRDSKPGVIVGRGKAQERAFEIQFDSPFVARHEDFSSASPSCCNLDIGIQCCNLADTTRFLNEIEDKEGQRAPGEEGIVRIIWNGLNTLPQAGEHLSLIRCKGDNTVVLPYDALIDVHWHRLPAPVVTPPSALSRWNQERQRARRNERQLPTPVSDDMDQAKSKITIRYNYQPDFTRVRNMVTQELRCIFCTHLPEHSSFERLYLHYLTHHEHFSFEASSTDENPSNKTIDIDLKKEKEFLSPEEQEEKANRRGFAWEAPPRPFDVLKHVDSGTSWIEQSLRRIYTLEYEKKKREEEEREEREWKAIRGGKGKAASGQAQDSKTVNRKRKNIYPSDVPDLPTKRRRVHLVPNVKGVRFYSAASKHRLPPGTEVADDDEDTDDTWMLQSQRRNLAEHGLDPIALDFNDLFNKHLNEERPTSDMFIRDAVIRFTRKFRQKLRDPKWTSKFQEKLQQLESRRVLDKITKDYCMDLVKPSRREGMGVSANERDGHPSTPTKGQTPVNDVFPDSPPSRQLAAESRIRWMGGKMSGGPRTFERFGRRRITCTRSGDAKSSIITRGVPELIGKDWKRVHQVSLMQAVPEEKVDKIQPADLDWNHFVCDVLEDDDLKYDRNTDNLACTNGGTLRLVEDEMDWIRVLTEVHREGPGQIKFELLSHEKMQGRLEEQRKRPDAVAGAPVATPQKRIPSGNGTEVASKQKKKKREKICVCGETADALRGTIACGNSLCHQQFHMKCVKVEKRTMEWRCEDCSSSL